MNDSVVYSPISTSILMYTQFYYAQKHRNSGCRIVYTLVNANQENKKIFTNRILIYFTNTFEKVT